MKAVAITGPADLRDQRWLDERIEDIESGVEAVIDIARNWSDGRNLARLHPGVAAAAYVTERVGTLGKSIVPILLAESNWSNRQIAAVAGVGKDTVNRAATGANAPVRPPSEHLDNPATWQKSGAYDRPAATLGADGRLRTATPARVPFRPVLAPDVSYAPRTVSGVVIDKPIEEEPPIDDAAWRGLVAVMDAIEALSDRDASSFAATVPDRRRAATAKKLRKLGTFLGRIAWTLEGNEA